MEPHRREDWQSNAQTGNFGEGRPRCQCQYASMLSPSSCLNARVHRGTGYGSFGDGGWRHLARGGGRCGHAATQRLDCCTATVHG
eukprot:1123359-Prymnesium_polylepis.1